MFAQRTATRFIPRRRKASTRDKTQSPEPGPCARSERRPASQSVGEALSALPNTYLRKVSLTLFQKGALAFEEVWPEEALNLFRAGLWCLGPLAPANRRQHRLTGGEGPWR